MSDGTHIQWTDATWNPTTGCTKVSPGCANCYIERTPAFRIAGRKFVNGATDLRLHGDRLTQPLRWRKPRRVFVNSLSDLFHESVPDEFIAAVFGIMGSSPRHTFQVLTKRIERAAAWFAMIGSKPTPLQTIPFSAALHCAIAAQDATGLSWTVPKPHEWPLPNVHIGVSAENQRFLDERLPLLLKVPAAVRFLSCEPLLGGLDISKHRPGANRLWVIVGGESGPGARPVKVWWIRNIVRQCQQSGTPVFVKQLGAYITDRNDAGFDGNEPESWPEMEPDDIEHDLDGTRDGYQGAPVRVHLKDRKGGDIAEWPADLRVREFPAALAVA